MNSTERLASLEEHIALEAFIASNPCPCPNCGEDKQLQLRNAFDTGGALWKCRKCGHRWHYTPQQECKQPKNL